MIIDLPELLMLRKAGLSLNELFVYLILREHKNKETGLSYPSQTRIGMLLGIQRRHVNRAVSGLVEKGVIKKKVIARKCYYEFSTSYPQRPSNREARIVPSPGRTRPTDGTCHSPAHGTLTPSSNPLLITPGGGEVSYPENGPGQKRKSPERIGEIINRDGFSIPHTPKPPLLGEELCDSAQEYLSKIGDGWSTVYDYLKGRLGKEAKTLHSVDFRKFEELRWKEKINPNQVLRALRDTFDRAEPVRRPVPYAMAIIRRWREEGIDLSKEPVYGEKKEI